MGLDIFDERKILALPWFWPQTFHAIALVSVIITLPDYSYKFTGRQNIIKYFDIPLLLDVIHSYVVVPYWLKETSCALFWCK